MMLDDCQINSCGNLRKRWKKSSCCLKKGNAFHLNELTSTAITSCKASISSPESGFHLVSTKSTDSGHFRLWKWPGSWCQPTEKRPVGTRLDFGFEHIFVTGASDHMRSHDQTLWNILREEHVP